MLILKELVSISALFLLMFTEFVAISILSEATSFPSFNFTVLIPEELATMLAMFLLMLSELALILAAKENKV